MEDIASVPTPVLQDEPTVLDSLRNMWEFANLAQFIFLFGRVFKIDENIGIEVHLMPYHSFHSLTCLPGTRDGLSRSTVYTSAGDWSCPPQIRIIASRFNVCSHLSARYHYLPPSFVPSRSD